MARFMAVDAASKNSGKKAVYLQSNAREIAL